MPARCDGARLPGQISNAIDAWSEYTENPVSHVAKAAGLVHFALSFDAESGRRVVEPRHHVIWFPVRDQGRQKHHSALFTLRVVQEKEISRDPNAQGPVANHLRFKPPAERKLTPGADEYVEFELKSREHEVPSQHPLRISMGPVRADKQTGQKEYVRVDMGQCIQRIATDVMEDPRGGQRFVQNRWWMCIETLRLLCNVDHIDCAALDRPGVAPQEWVIRLMDTHAPINRKEELEERKEDRDIDDLMDFIDNHGPGRGGSIISNGTSQKSQKGKKKKASKDKELGDTSDKMVAGTGVAGATPTSPMGESAGDRCENELGNIAGQPETGNPPRFGLTAQPNGSNHTGNVNAPAPAPERVPQPALFKQDDGVDATASRPPLRTSQQHQHDPVFQVDDVAAAANAPAALPSPHHASDAGLDTDLMGELLGRYRRLQERSGRVEVDAKVTVVRELLEVLDELERADAELKEDTPASRVIFSAARKFEAKLRSLGLVRVEALGKPYNGVLHRAVGDESHLNLSNRADGTMPGNNGEGSPCGGELPQVVVEELESGWVLGENIVRPALVTLG